MRRGLTLIEILLVLAVLVMVAALAVPSVNIMLEGQRLRKSGDKIHAEWAKARNVSMRTGRMHVFRCKVGLDEYEIRPWYAADDALESSAPHGGAGSASAGPTGSASAPSQSATGSAFTTSQHLPSGILFAEGLAEQDIRSAKVDEAIAASGGEWGQPILFYPDGTTSTARVLLSNRRQQYVRLDLRGLTGMTEVSGFLTKTEATQ